MSATFLPFCRISPIPNSTVEDTREYIKEQIFTTPDSSGAIGRTFSFAIILADDLIEKVIRAVGIHSLVPAPVIWYHTHPYSWGQSFASEAVGGLLDAWWKLPRTEIIQGNEEGTEKLFAGCGTANLASLHILSKHGFRTFKEITLLGGMRYCLK
jgi:RimJ/RimL family protein N-acetyltransferase